MARFLAGRSIEDLFEYSVYNFSRIAHEREQAVTFVRALWPKRHSPDTGGLLRAWVRQVRECDLERGLLLLGLTRQDVGDVLKDLGVSPAVTVHPVAGPAWLLAEMRGAPADLLASVKIGPGTRFGGPPTDKEWSRASAARHPSEAGRLAKLARWEFIGDYMVGLYDLIAPRIPSRPPAGHPRVSWRKRSRRSLLDEGPVPTTYSKGAAELVALIVNRHFGWYFARPVTARDVKSRLQARGRAAPPGVRT
jgi:hypothetical protein